MSNILRQSTSIDVRIGPFVDVSDAVSPETGITLGAADQAEILKANGAATADISGATWAAVTGADGWYDLTLTTSHTDTVGEMVVVVQDASVCLPVFARFQVVEEAIYDAMFAASATGLLPANVTQISGSATAADNAETCFTGTITTLDALDTAQDTQHSTTQSAITTVDSNVDAILVDTGTTLPGILGTPSGADLAADIAANQTDLNAILTDLTDGTVVVGTLNAAALADLFNTDSGTTYGSAVSGSVVKEIADNSGGGTPPTASAIADAVWDEAQSGHVTAGTFGAYLDTAVSGIGGAAGAGSDSVTLTIKNSAGTIIPDAGVWITTDAAGTNVVAGTLRSADDGTVTFMLTAGTTYYCWRDKASVNFTNPQSFTAVAD